MDQEEMKIATIYTTFCIILNIENTAQTLIHFQRI